MSFIDELKRRNVFRVAIAYLALAWLLIEMASTLFPGFGIPSWAFRFVVIVLVLGFVPTLLFSWAYEITPDGLKREKEISRDASITHLTAKRLDKLTIGLILVALVFILFDRFWLRSRLVEEPQVSADVAMNNAPVPEQESEYPSNSIAVLPFANRSANPDDVYFVDGIHDDLLTYISQIGSIKTISRTSVMKYRDSTKSIPEIASELGVVTVLEGGVQRAGDTVRINVQLIDARADNHLWSKIYDRQLTAANIFTIQSEIAESISSALRATLTPTSRERIDRIPTENLEALEAYFLGRQKMVTRTVSDLASAAGHFEEAVARDPGFALAYVGLADTYLLQGSYGGLTWKEGIAKSKAAAEKALQLDSNLGEAYAADAKRRGWDGDDEGAEAAFKRAIELSPNYAPAYQWYGEMLIYRVGRITEALELSRNAVMLDPQSAIILNDYAEVLESAGRIEEALAYYQKSVEIEPRFSTGYQGIGFVLATRMGRLDDALAPWQMSLSIEPDDWWMLQNVGFIYLNLGDLEQAEHWKNRALEIVPENTVPDLVVALHVYRGNESEALKYARMDVDDFYDSLPSLRVIRDQATTAAGLQEARDLFERVYPQLFDESALRIDQTNREAAVDLAYLLLKSGERAQAERLLDHSLASVTSGIGVSAGERSLLEARIHVLGGDRPKALAALQRAVEQGWRWFAWYFLEHDPVLAPLHGEPEFQSVKAEINADMARQLERVRSRDIEGKSRRVPAKIQPK